MVLRGATRSEIAPDGATLAACSRQEDNYLRNAVQPLRAASFVKVLKDGATMISTVLTDDESSCDMVVELRESSHSRPSY